MNEKAGKRQIPLYAFRQYVEDVYLPMCRRKWKASTWMTSEPLITFHLLPSFGAKLMKDLKRDTMSGLPGP